MNAKEYAAATTQEQQIKVIELAGTKWGYWEHMTYLRKRPGVDLARRLVAASKIVTPDTPMTLDALLIPGDQLRGKRAS